MKLKDYKNELNAKSLEELQSELVAAKKELFNLRFQNATNQLENTSRIKVVRKNIARIQTVIAQKVSRLTLPLLAFITRTQSFFSFFHVAYTPIGSWQPASISRTTARSARRQPSA